MTSPPPDPGPPTHRRPFGVLVVALIQLGTVVLALISLAGSWAMPWEGTLVVYLQEHTWARSAILTFGGAVLVAVIGLWQLRYWGWAFMVALVGVSLVFDLTNWWQSGGDAGLQLYARLGLDVVSAFYLNTSAVQDAFRRPSGPGPGPTPGGPSAAEVEP